MRRPRFLGAPFVLFGILFVAVMGAIIVMLWNALMPEIFDLPKITFWQAVGLFILSRILFGNFGGWGSRMRRARFVRGWNGLTPEERERFRQAMEACPGNRGGSDMAPRTPEA